MIGQLSKVCMAHFETLLSSRLGSSSTIWASITFETWNDENRTGELLISKDRLVNAVNTVAS